MAMHKKKPVKKMGGGMIKKNGMTKAMRGGGTVSYTHLTLPTTPYV